MFKKNKNTIFLPKFGQNVPTSPLKSPQGIQLILLLIFKVFTTLHLTQNLYTLRKLPQELPGKS